MNTALDRIDCRILAELQNHGRLSNKELAARVHLSPSSTLERVRRLESKGVIRGYHAEVEAGALGGVLQALIMVRLGQHSRKVVELFRNETLQLPEVVAIFNVSGVHDFLIHVIVPSTDHLRNLALESFTSRFEVVHIETSLIFEHVRKPTVPNLSASANGV